MSIDAATEENGCLELVAGLHADGLIGEEWKPMTEDIGGQATGILPYGAGDVVFFDYFVRMVPDRIYRRKAPGALRDVQHRLAGDHRGTLRG